jgi:3-hydroxyisobutyrate dehydrogenase
MSKITVLGLGAMGSRMAINYAAAGHDVTVWNRTTSTAGQLATTHHLTAAQTPRTAADGADFVVSMVSNDEAALDVWMNSNHGALAGMAPGAVAIESSTLTPGTARKLGDAALTARIRFIEAPVVGSRPQADAGALFYILSGDNAAVEAARPIIDINAGNTTHVGSIGNAATLKLAINGLFAAQVAAYAEIAGFIERSDLDTVAAFKTLTALPITSPGLQRILGLIADRNYEPNFPIHLVAKDLSYLAAAARDADAAIPIVDATKSVFEQSTEGDERNLDIAGVAQRYQRQEAHAQHAAGKPPQQSRS